MTDPKTGADQLARALHRAGCRFAFGIPGGEVLDLVAAFERAGIRFVVVRHENAGGFMAEGTHHASGAPAVLLATVGPGVANCANVVANAEQDRVPLIVVTGCHDEAHLATYTHQIFDHRALLGPLTKLSLRVPPGAVEPTVRKAVAAALDGRPGPVHLDVPIPVAKGVSTEAEAPLRPRVAPSRPEESEALVQAHLALANAERPLAIVGLDALDERSGFALRAMIERWGAPLLTTYKAKGVVPESHALALGAFGLSPKADAVLQPLVRAADAVLLVGYDPVEVRAPWTAPFGPDATVVALSAEADRHAVHRIDHLFVGDIAAGLISLAEGMLPGSRWIDGEPQAAKEALAEAFRPPDDWGPGALFDALAEAVPAETRWTVDTGAHRILLSQQLIATWPRQVLQSTGLCTMGCALPLAIGCRLVEPDRPAVAVVGDGGLEMVLGELATARDLGVGVLVVVVDDQSLALIEKKQRALGLPNAGVDFGATDFGGTDFAAVANAMGCVGVRCDDRESLQAAVADGLARTDRPTVLHCPIPRRAYDGAI